MAKLRIPGFAADGSGYKSGVRYRRTPARPKKPEFLLNKLTSLLAAQWGMYSADSASEAFGYAAAIGDAMSSAAFPSRRTQDSA